MSYYHRDEQLSTAFITGEYGVIQNSYSYDAFGVEAKVNEQFSNCIRYTGQQYDELSEQYYLRARFYNPVFGRFTQEDTYWGDGLNLYAYCGNNPVVYYDPSGFTTRKERQTIKDMNGFLMGDSRFSGTLPSNSWILTQDGMGAHLYERSNVSNRSSMNIFAQDSAPTYYPYGTPENAGQAHLRLHDATAEAGIKLKTGNPNLSDTELMKLYEQAYSSPDLNNIRGDLRLSDGSKVIGTDLTPEDAFKKLNEWGVENDENFSALYDERTRKEENTDDEIGTKDSGICEPPK